MITRMPPWPRFVVAATAGLFLVLGASAAAAQTNTVSAVSPTSCVTSVQTCATVPVQISRTDATALFAFSVTFTLSPELSLCSPSPAITEGTYLSGAGPTSFMVRDRGDGTYTADGTMLGASNCGPTDSSGTLFDIRVMNSGGSGTGTVTISSVILRDCSNGTMASDIGSAGSVTIDLNPVTVTPISDQTVAETSLLTVTPSATLSSCATGPASWSATGLPAGTNIDPETGVITWTPDCEAAEVNGGVYGPISVTALATTGETGSTSFNITVTNTLGAVSLAAISDPTVAELATLTVTPVATLTGCARTPLAWTATGLPSGAAIDPVTGVVTWVPGCSAAETNSGLYGPVTVTATAVEGETDSRSFSIQVTNTTVGIAAVSGLSAATVQNGNGSGGTTGITVQFTPPSGATAIEVYRARFGNYPEYDDAPGAGAAPIAPSYPPGGPWTLTGVTASGQVDAPPTRDFWYYVAFAKNECNEVSSVSALSTGALDYHLGDVSNGFALTGNNLVNTADISELGMHYGLSGGSVLPFDYLDVGPTTTNWLDGRPTTDDEIDFEDLIIFALSYGMVSAPERVGEPVATAVTGSNQLSLESPAQVAMGDAVSARLTLHGAGDLAAVSTQLSWDPAVVAPVSSAAGDWLLAQGGVALSAKPGTVDAAALGSRVLRGEGVLASVSFKVLAAGDPAIRLLRADGRDAKNQKIAVNLAQAPTAPALPKVTGISAAIPNPTPQSTAISFSLASGGPMDLSVYTVNGRLVKTLVHEMRGPGEYRSTWSGLDESGQRAGAGVYFARLSALQGQFTRTLTLLK